MEEMVDLIIHIWWRDNWREAEMISPVTRVSPAALLEAAARCSGRWGGWVSSCTADGAQDITAV